MKRYKCFMVMVAMVALMLPCNANEAVQAAATTAAENMTGKNIAKLYKVRTEAENPDQREVIIQACIAGLYAIGDTKNAKKINQGEKRDGFIDSLMKECDLCHGEGRSQEGCYKCKGSGACQNRKCNNGIVTTAGFDGRSNVRKCSNCGGSGKCTNCKGTGKVARTCSRCNGSKKVIDKSIALASCKDMLNALIACGNEIQNRKKAEGATQLAQQMVEKEKQAREKAESDARLAEQGAENEKRQREQAEESARLAQQKADSERQARAKAEGDVRLAQQNAENEKRAREKAEGDARLAEQNAKDEKLEREKAEETARLAQTNAEREKQFREKAEEEVPQNVKVKAEEKPQKEGGCPLKKGYSHKKLESLFGIEFGWEKPDSWKDSGYRLCDVVPAYDFSPNKKFLDFNYYTVLFDDEGKAFYVRAMKQCSNLEEAYALKRKAIEVIELKYGVAMEEFGTLASGKTSLVSARAYFGDELFKQELNKSYARIQFDNSREIIVGQIDNKVIVYGNEPAMQNLAVIGYRLRQTTDGVDAL